ncbi:MAG: Nif3-like dinuclear metal center hexameric protein [Clostridia bacterium]|nr:Nif3-like dinuclear metal center hexameric protein [Clostridia bacterium]
MTVQDIYTLLKQKAPIELAEERDNVGLLVGDATAEVSTVVVALDVTDAVIETAVQNKAELVITHHPVIFDPLKTVTADSRVHRLIRAGISVISMHTNADKTVGGVNDCLAEKLGLSDVEIAPDGMCRIGKLSASMTAEVFASYVSQCLDTAVRVKAGTDMIRTVALCGGGGAAMVLPLLDVADAALTGEVKHHEWLSVPSDKTLVDGGHYATENAITDRFCEWLQEDFPDLMICHHKGEAPYSTIKG